MNHFAYLMILLVSGHALGDLSWQTDQMASAKYSKVSHFPWWLAIFYHSSIHAGIVLVITQSVPCAIAEWVIHFSTDSLRVNAIISGRVDQSIHIACKVAFAAILTWSAA